MNILFVSAVFPYPLYSGGQIRIYNLLKVLSQKHSISLLSFIRTKEERTLSKELPFLSSVHTVYRGKAISSRYLIKVFGKYPLLMASYDNATMREAIADALSRRKYDLVHIEPFYVYPSLPKLSVPLVVGEHNIEYLVYKDHALSYPFSLLRPLLIADAEKMRRWEKRIWHSADWVTAVSTRDARHIQPFVAKRVTVVPNGVDTSSFKFTLRTFDKTKPSCMYVGNFSWLPNREAIRRLLTDIWPAIVHSYPNATLAIAGQSFPASLNRNLGRNVSVLEPDDIQCVYAASDILLAPIGIRGGTKFKILEAMANGTLVISTQAGHDGIGTATGIQMLEAKTPEDFVSAISQVYDNPRKACTITKRASKFVERYSWQNIAQKLDFVWRSQS